MNGPDCCLYRCRLRTGCADPHSRGGCMSRAERDFRDPPPASMPPSTDDVRLVDALRHGDEAAFVTLVERYQHGLVRLALIFAPSHTAAEQAVQETWLDVLQGVLHFEGRASLKLWIFRLLIERLAARGEYVPFALEADAAS